MNLIEQAAERLAQLRRAGIEIPETAGHAEPPAEAPAAAVPRPESTDTVSTKQVAIDLDALAAAGFLTPHATKSLLSNEYRVIKRPLLANAIGKGAAPIDNGNLIMVTSAVPGEGKTFTSINLAISIAMELDYTVMLVDADVSKPSILNNLGLAQEPGLLDVLLDDSLDLSDVLLRTNIEKLTLLPSGSPHPRATELLASDAMNDLLRDMANRYKDRIIIFDSPPLLLTTEARALAAHMGQIVMVTAAEKTMHHQVKQALTTIESCPVKLLVLNGTRPDPLGAYGYGYGYGYGFGSYGQAAEPADAARAAPAERR